jgi:hypothetical protein
MLLTTSSPLARLVGVCYFPLWRTLRKSTGPLSLNSEVLPCEREAVPLNFLNFVWEVYSRTDGQPAFLVHVVCPVVKCRPRASTFHKTLSSTRCAELKGNTRTAKAHHLQVSCPVADEGHMLEDICQQRSREKKHWEKATTMGIIQPAMRVRSGASLFGEKSKTSYPKIKIKSETAERQRRSRQTSNEK